VGDTEQRLYVFDPFGVTICDGPFRIFKWQRQNVRSSSSPTAASSCSVGFEGDRHGGMPQALGHSRLRGGRRRLFDLAPGSARR
jgi:hypothetical protein